MAIFDFITNKLRAKILQSLYQYEIHSGSVNIMPDNPDEYIEQGYAGNTTVYSIINRIDNMRKQANLKLYKKLPDGQKEEIFDHELLKFIDKVNTSMYMDDFITAHLVYLLTIGEFFVYKPSIKTGIDKGRVIEIFEMPSNEVEIIEGTMFSPIRGYKIEGNQNIEFEVDEVYHSKFFNPNYKKERSLHGLSPLRAAAKTVSKLNEIEKTQLKQFENQGAPYILYKEITGSGNAIDSNANRLTDVQRAELAKQIKNSASEKTRGLPLVTKDKMGRLDLGQKLADLGVIESSAAGIIALCAVYGVPPELFGYGQKTYNNMATARKSAWTDCIMPNLDRVRQTLNACTISGIESYKDLTWDFDLSEVEELQEGIKEKVDWMVKSKWSANEIRVATGKSPIEDPLMDEPIINMGESFLSDYSIDLGDENKSFEDYLK